MGVMYLLRGLLNVLQDYTTWEYAADSRCLVYTRVLAMMCAATQEEFPYHIDRGVFVVCHVCMFVCECLYVRVCLSVCLSV